MAILGALLNTLILICSIFLICLVLIQRGKGGGLAGAFGGMGGSSAFGTKAGDVFTKITIVTAAIWFLLAMILVIINNQPRISAFDAAGDGPSTVVTLPEGPAGAATKPGSEAIDTAGGGPAAPPATKPAQTTTPSTTPAPVTAPAPTIPGLPPALEDEPSSSDTDTP